MIVGGAELNKRIKQRRRGKGVVREKIKGETYKTKGHWRGHMETK